MKRGHGGKGVFKIKREKRSTRSGGISAAFFGWQKDHGGAACDFQILFSPHRHQVVKRTLGGVENEQGICQDSGWPEAREGVRLSRLLYLVELGSDEGSLAYFWLGEGILIGGFGAARRRGSVTDPYFSICLYRRTWFAFYGWRGEKERDPLGLLSLHRHARYPPSKRSALLNSLVCMHCQLFVRAFDDLRGALVSSVYVLDCFAALTCVFGLLVYAS